MRKAWLGVLSLGVVGMLAPACSGAEFGAADADGSAGEATGGVPTEVNGGAPTNASGGAGESSGGTSAGSSSRAGEGGVGTGESGAGVGGVAPECRPDEPPPQVAGDCKGWSCVAGEATNTVDLKDLPVARGVCDVPSCTEAGPALHADDNKCAANKHCVEGNCACRACPNGKLANVEAGTCLIPTGVTAVANKSGTGSSAAGAIDGTTAKTWNSGTTDGTLTLTLATPQAMTALVVYVTGQDGNGGMVAKTISVTAIVELSDASSAPISKSGTWDYSSMSTGPVRLELGLVKASKITLKFSSPSSWIAVNEVLFVVCS